MARDRGAADGQRVGQLADRAVAVLEQLDDRAAVGIAERVERVAGESLEGDCPDGSRIVTVAGTMKSYEVTETIAASPGEVWAVVEDVARYPDWDSGVERVEGRLAPGEKLKVYSEANPGRAFPVKVAELASGRMTWSGGMPLGLFKGVRTYRVVPEGSGSRFTMREEYTGPLLPLIWRTMPDLQPSFDKFARGLKARVESSA